MAASRNKPSTDLPKRVGAFLAARLAPDGLLSVGLSGGCDSVVLLHALVALGLGKRLQAIHIHHGLSPNADAWADFCADYCRRLGVSLVTRRVAVDTTAGLGLEAAARNARYAAFGELAGNTLLLAHHRGDQAETVLFNLLRGAGVTGAAGIPAERRFGPHRLLRPLLDVSRGEIEAYARHVGLAWIDDESNGDTAITRNFLRHQTLVALGQRFPAAESALALAASHFAEAGGLLDELAELDWQRVAEGGAARLGDLRHQTLVALGQRFPAAESALALAASHFAEAGALLDELAELDWQRVAEGSTARLGDLRQLSVPRVKNLLRHRLRLLGWQVPVASRLDEFVRQVVTAGPDRHPELVLPDGKMRVAQRRLHWLSGK